MASPISTPSTSTTQCKHNSCDGRVYKNNFCVEHYVQFGDSKPSIENVTEEKVSNDSNTTDLSNTHINSTDSQQVKKTNKFAMFGGGGQKCVVCDKTSYPAESIQFESRIYHADCFSCITCHKKLDNATQAALYESNVYCRTCFNKQGLNRKQAEIKSWNKSLTQPLDSSVQPATTPRSKFGGGGLPCHKCSLTVYNGEAQSYDGKLYHPQCLLCGDCDRKLVMSDIGGAYNDRTLCRPCWNKGGYAQKQRDAGGKPHSNTNTYNPKFAALGGGGAGSCVKCSKLVYGGEAVSYNNKIYHPQCMNCADCQKNLPVSEVAGEYDNNTLCRPCWNKGGYAAKQRDIRPRTPTSTNNASTVSNKFANLGGGGGSPCVQCQKTVYSGEAISYNSKLYHPDCLKCNDCDKKLSMVDIGGEYDTHTLCKPCWNKGGYAAKQRDTVKNNANSNITANKYNSKFATLGGGGAGPCSTCHSTVYNGEAQSYEGKIYHPQCMSCSDCHKKCDIPDIGGAYNNQLLCRPCWNKGGYAAKQRDAFSKTLPTEHKKSTVASKFATLGGGGLKCVSCSKTTYPAESISFENQLYHATCFRCCHCNRDIQQLSAAEGKAGKVYCNKCFNELELWKADK